MGKRKFDDEYNVLLKGNAKDKRTMDRVGASLGETQKFECKVIGYPIPKIKWYKDDLEISGDSRYDVDFDPNRGVVTLAIKNLTLADEGLYQCRAENSEGLASTMTYLAIKSKQIIFNLVYKIHCYFYQCRIDHVLFDYFISSG